MKNNKHLTPEQCQNLLSYLGDGYDDTNSCYIRAITNYGCELYPDDEWTHTNTIGAFLSVYSFTNNCYKHFEIIPCHDINELMTLLSGYEIRYDVSDSHRCSDILNLYKDGKEIYSISGSNRTILTYFAVIYVLDNKK